MEKNDKYWMVWEKPIEAASNLQGLFPDAVLVGGSAATIHTQHRFSFDADHVLSDLEHNYKEVLDFLEKRDDRKTTRLNPPKLILRHFQGVETGLRQLRRNLPLENRNGKYPRQAIDRSYPAGNVTNKRMDDCKSKCR